ncbi:MAG: polyamine aminopropyltransferase [Burkholderiales bacterium]|nr:polyamine aminopropyltransferase [Burkholderiales bacterium]
MKFLAKWRVRKPADDAETVYVSEKFGVRSLHIGSDTVQSAMRIAKPNELELSYTRSMMGFMLFNEHPARVLMIGLGGGSLAKFLYHRLPQSTVRVVEINPQVVAIARRYFHVPADDVRFTVVIGDGADCASEEGGTFDLIVVDGYDAESHVEELSSRTFYAGCCRRLDAGGMLVVNLWGGDRAFGETLRRIEAAFPAGTLCLPAEKPGNVAVFAFRTHPGNPLWDELAARAAGLQQRYDLEFPRFVEGLRKMNRHDDRRLFVD